MNKIINVLFAIIIWYISSVMYLSYNNLIDVNQEINKKIVESKKIKNNIKETDKNLQKEREIINNITKDFSFVKNTNDNITKTYYLVIEKHFNSNINMKDFNKSNIKIVKWKERLFLDNIKNSYKKDIKKIYKISWKNGDEFSLFTWNLDNIKNSKNNLNTYIINITFNYSLNKNRIFEMLKTIYRSYNIRFIASNCQQLFTYLQKTNISYNTKNKLEILNIINIISKYKILFNNEEEQKIKEDLKTILYNTMK